MIRRFSLFLCVVSSLGRASCDLGLVGMMPRVRPANLPSPRDEIFVTSTAQVVTYPSSVRQRNPPVVCFARGCLSLSLSRAPLLVPLNKSWRCLCFRELGFESKCFHSSAALLLYRHIAARGQLFS